jgi:hypothetical protein
MMVTERLKFEELTTRLVSYFLPIKNKRSSRLGIYMLSNRTETGSHKMQQNTLNRVIKDEKLVKRLAGTHNHRPAKRFIITPTAPLEFHALIENTRPLRNYNIFIP